MLTNPKERAEYLFREVANIDPDKFNEPALYYALGKWDEAVNAQPIFEPTVIGGYTTPKTAGRKDLLRIRVKQFYEITSADFDPNTLKESHNIVACMYRKDWSIPITDEEIINTADFFYHKPVIYTLWAIQLMGELFQTLKSKYPQLYDEEKEEVSKEDNPRKMSAIVNSLAQGDFTKWSIVMQEEIKLAFMYLEEQKKQEILRNRSSYEK